MLFPISYSSFMLFPISYSSFMLFLSSGPPVHSHFHSGDLQLMFMT